MNTNINRQKNPHLNCIENCLMLVCQKASIDHFPMFLKSWDFGYNPNKSDIGQMIHYHRNFDFNINNNQKKMDITLAAEALKDLISPNSNREVTPELIIDVVSEHFNVPISDLKSGKRNAEIATARQIAMYLCRKMTDTPLKTIGLLLGGRDHSTVNHGVDKIANDVENNETLRNTIDIIKKKINPV